MKLIWWILTLLLVGLALTAGKCNDGCEKELTKCDDEALRICNDEQNWELIQRCDDFEPGTWYCDEDTDGVAKCLEDTEGGE